VTQEIIVNDIKRFQVGTTYADNFTGDSQLWSFFRIEARTAKTITTEVHGKRVVRRLSVYNGVEQFKPYGSYSMAMIVNANDTLDRVPMAARLNLTRTLEA
jgi:hypothetical protein